MSKDVMKLALEALEYIYEGANNQGPHTGISWRCVSKKAAPVITALREALAEPDFWEGYVPEPVKPATEESSATQAQQALDKKAENARELGLDYEPAQKPVTPCTHPSLGFSSLREDGAASRWSCVMCGTEFVPKATQRWTEFNEATKRNIEHAEWYMSTHSNLAEQAPTAWILKCGEQQELWWEKPPFGEATPLYTSPPAQRTWVSLTDEEVDECFEFIIEDSTQAVRFYRAIEAKLKEMNT